MKGKTKTTKGKVKCVTVTTIKGKRVTNEGKTLPKGVFVNTTNRITVTYIARPWIKGKRIYLGSFPSINKAKKAIKEANG